MTLIHPDLKQIIKEAESRDAYWVERAKLDFAVALERRCRASGISNTQLAKKLGTSAAYITKVFRGDTNFTIETMVKLARSAGAALDVKLADESAKSILAPVVVSTGAIVVEGNTPVVVANSGVRNVALQQRTPADLWRAPNLIEVKSLERGAWHA